MRVISTRSATHNLNADQAEHAFRTSISFQIASTRAFETKFEDDTFKAAIVPAVVCAAFAVELGMKARIIYDGNKEQYKELKGSSGHNLERLFALLSDTDRGWFIEGTKLPKSEFIEKLALVSKAFVDWRYVHEKTEQIIDYKFLSELAVLASTLPSSLDIISEALGDPVMDVTVN